MIYCVLIFGSILLSTRIRPLKQLFPCSSNRFTLFWQERLLMSLADLISMTALLGITAPVREAAAAFGRGDARGKGSIMVYSRWVEPRPGQGPGSNGCMKRCWNVHITPEPVHRWRSVLPTLFWCRSLFLFWSRFRSVWIHYFKQ